jgi:hypothetical protein
MASFITSSNTFDRWLISVIDIPEPPKFKNESLISSRTLRGSAAGPALKLWILSSFMGFLHRNRSQVQGSTFRVRKTSNSSHQCDTAFIVVSKLFHPIDYGRYSGF